MSFLKNSETYFADLITTLRMFITKIIIRTNSYVRVNSLNINKGLNRRLSIIILSFLINKNKWKMHLRMTEHTHKTK